MVAALVSIFCGFLLLAPPKGCPCEPVTLLQGGGACSPKYRYNTEGSYPRGLHVGIQNERNRQFAPTDSHHLRTHSRPFSLPLKVTKQRLICAAKFASQSAATFVNSDLLRQLFRRYRASQNSQVWPPFSPPPLSQLSFASSFLFALQIFRKSPPHNPTTLLTTLRSEHDLI